MIDKRRAPVQRTSRLAKPGGTIAWSEHEEAWKEFQKMHPAAAARQDAERVAERGGFGVAEVAKFLGHGPKTFEPHPT